MRQLKIIQQITHRDDKSVDLYLQEVTKYSMVSAEEEVQLSMQIRQGDERALQKLVEANLRFVISVAKQYQNQGLSLADLINEGNIGLIKAAGKFDETRGFKFISYAVWWIRQGIIQAISNHTRIVRLPLNRLSNIKKISRASAYLSQIEEREPTDSEIAEYLDMQEHLVRENKELNPFALSLDMPMKSDHDNDFSLHDIIGSDDLNSPDTAMLADSVKTDILRAMGKLDIRESEIISLYFGFGSGEAYNLHEIADMMNLTRERVRQIKSASLLKIRKMISGTSSFYDNN